MMYAAIGDIHGRINRLDEVLELTKEYDPYYIFLGDYVDRGHDSRKVLSRVKEVVDNGYGVALLGNHDQQWVSWLENPRSPQNQWWYQSYLKKTRNSYYSKEGFLSKLMYQHGGWLKGLQTSYNTKDWFFSHSGDPSDLLWGRPQGDFLIGGLYNVHGHTPLKEPFVGEGRCNLDTGCAWYDGHLTCALFEEGTRKPVKLVRSTE